MTPPKPATTKEDRQEARNLLAKAPGILQLVDESDLLQQGKRSYPTFARSEVKAGPILGSGGYCSVFEIQDFELIVPTVVEGTVDSKEVAAAETESSEVDAKRSSSVSFSPDTAELLKGSFALEDTYEDEPHYDVEGARQLMKDHVLRNGEARYAVKSLKSLNELERARGMIDLAIEAKFLSVLWHPNIGTCFYILTSRT